MVYCGWLLSWTEKYVANEWFPLETRRLVKCIFSRRFYERIHTLDFYIVEQRSSANTRPTFKYANRSSFTVSRLAYLRKSAMIVLSSPFLLRKLTQFIDGLAEPRKKRGGSICFRATILVFGWNLHAVYLGSALFRPAWLLFNDDQRTGLFIGSRASFGYWNSRAREVHSK